MSNESKDLCTAYLLWAFCGFFGIHRFYLESNEGAMVYLLLWFIGFFFIFPWLIIPFVWIVDAFLIPRMYKAYLENYDPDCEAETKQDEKPTTLPQSTTCTSPQTPVLETQEFVEETSD